MKRKLFIKKKEGKKSCLEDIREASGASKGTWV